MDWIPACAGMTRTGDAWHGGFLVPGLTTI